MTFALTHRNFESDTCCADISSSAHGTPTISGAIATWLHEPAISAGYRIRRAHRPGKGAGPAARRRAAALRPDDTFALQIVGSNNFDRFEMDPYQQKLQRKVAALTERGIAVDQPGHLTRAALPDALRRTQIHIVPSRWDVPFGLTTLEDMATGVAVVASRTGGTPEVVGDTGLMFERDDRAGLCACLEKLQADPKLRTDLAQRARRRAEGFSWRHSWQGFEVLMRALDSRVKRTGIEGNV